MTAKVQFLIDQVNDYEWFTKIQEMIIPELKLPLKSDKSSEPDA